MECYIKWLFLVITVMFEHSIYKVDEDAGPAQPVLVLNCQSSMECNVTVFNTNGSASGEYCSMYNYLIDY